MRALHSKTTLIAEGATAFKANHGADQHAVACEQAAAGLGLLKHCIRWMFSAQDLGDPTGRDRHQPCAGMSLHDLESAFRSMQA